MAFALWGCPSMPASKVAQQNKLRNRIMARIGYLSAGYGVTPESVSAAMEGEVSPADVSTAWQLFGFAPKVLLPGHEVISVAMAGRHRTLICQEAQRRGMDLPDLSGAILSRTADDGLFAALLD